MPKVQYTNAKGLFQQAGTGITVANDAIITARDIAFGCGYDPAGMTTTAKNNAACEAGFSIANNVIIDSAWDGTNDMDDIVLPAATVGAYVIIRQTAEADGANKHIEVNRAGTDTFAADQVVACGTGLAGLTDVSAVTDVKLTITSGGTTNYGWGGVGSSLHFYCRTAGQWLVKAHSVPNGTGAGGSVVFS